MSETSEISEISKTSNYETALSAKVIGVGDAGCRAADLLAAKPLPGVECLALNSDVRGLQEIRTAHKVQLGKDLLRGLSAGGDLELGRASAERAQDFLKKHFDNSQLIILLGGLGGGTGSGALPVIARQAREAGALVLSFVSLPFDLEGQERRRRADRGLKQLLATSDAVISIPNQTFLKMLDERTGLPESFDFINHTFLQGVRGIWQMIEPAGLINVSFQDLRSIVQSKHSKSTFAVAEAEGANRSRDIVSALMEHPLLSGEEQLKEADALLVNLVGGNSLSLSETDRVMEQLRQQIGNVPMIVGASIDVTMGERLGLTLIASWHRKSPLLSLRIDAPHGEDFIFPVPIERGEMEASFFKGSSERIPSATRYVAPPPTSSDRQTNQLFSQSRLTHRQRHQTKKQIKKGTLKLESIARGRFEKSAPTLHKGEDLDVPTFLRQGGALN